MSFNSLFLLIALLAVFTNAQTSSRPVEIATESNNAAIAELTTTTATKTSIEVNTDGVSQTTTNTETDAETEAVINTTTQVSNNTNQEIENTTETITNNNNNNTTAAAITDIIETTQINTQTEEPLQEETPKTIAKSGDHEAPTSSGMTTNFASITTILFAIFLA